MKVVPFGKPLVRAEDVDVEDRNTQEFSRRSAANPIGRLTVPRHASFMIGGSVMFSFLAELLESGIRAQRIPDWIEF